MTTPIYDFLEKYKNSGVIRAHMPGHKGRGLECGFDSAFPYDITEIKGADVLFDAEGIINESEKNASELFGTAATFFSAGGSTLCIQAMLAAACGKDSAFICARNSHRAVMNTAVLLNLEPCWIFPKYEDGSAVSGCITPCAVEKAILKYQNKKPSCVFITSPDYLGRLAPVKEIAEICHRYGLPLLVDNAHGAYLAFLDENIHPIALGADMCCDSAHKTLPVLTGGAYLHVADGDFAEKLIPKIKRSMALFGTTSPSYLIMASLDLLNRYLTENFRNDLYEAVKRIKAFREYFMHLCVLKDTEPMKITFYTIPSGLTGYQLAEQLRSGGIEPEYADETNVVLMMSVSSTEEDFARLTEVCEKLVCPKIRIIPPKFEIKEMECAMLPREAFFSDKEIIEADNSCGRIAAESITVCPPCVPVAAAGEVIDENAVKILKMYSIFKVNVVK